MKTQGSNSRTDMTKGAMLPLVVSFALPLILGNILQQLYNMVDTLVIGNFCGSVDRKSVV